MGAEVQGDVGDVEFGFNFLIDGGILGVAAIIALELFLVLGIIRSFEINFS